MIVQKPRRFHARTQTGGDRAGLGQRRLQKITVAAAGGMAFKPPSIISTGTPVGKSMTVCRTLSSITASGGKKAAIRRWPAVCARTSNCRVTLLAGVDFVDFDRRPLGPLLFQPHRNIRGRRRAVVMHRDFHRQRHAGRAGAAARLERRDGQIRPGLVDAVDQLQFCAGLVQFLQQLLQFGGGVQSFVRKSETRNTTLLASPPSPTICDGGFQRFGRPDRQLRNVQPLQSFVELFGKLAGVDRFVGQVGLRAASGCAGLRKPQQREFLPAPVARPLACPSAG